MLSSAIEEKPRVTYEKHALSSLPPLYRDMWETSVLRRLREAVPILFQFGWIAGGAVRRAMLGTEMEAPKGADIDFFFNAQADWHSWRQACYKLDLGGEKEKAHAIEFTLTVPGLVRVKLQAIRNRYFRDVFALVDDFDFTHCQFAIGGDWLTIGPTSTNDAMGKRLVIANTQAPVAAIRRIHKYQREGFKISDAQIKKLLRAAAAAPDTIDTPLLEEYVE